MIETKPCTPSALNVTLLKGGTSGEREVSLMSGAACASALSAEGFNVTEVDTGEPDMIQQIIASKPDVVFIALHGKDGEDGRIQGLCELLRVPYTGPGVLASALAMDKARSKVFYRAHGVPTPPSLAITRGQTYSLEQIIRDVGQKVVVKPVEEGSALGVVIEETPQDIARAIEEELASYESVIVERYVAGTEVTVAVLGGKRPEALPVIEIVPWEASAFYDYEAKYAPGGATHIIPARISDALTQRCQQAAVAAHEALGCWGVSRSDMIIDEAGECWVLETNTIPGMTETSLLPHTAASVGIEFGPLCRMLVELGIERFEEEYPEG